MTSPARRVVVLTADVGEGHLAAARAIADELRATTRGVEVTTLDALELLGPTLRLVLRDAYRFQLQRLPWLFGLLFGLFLRVRMLRSAGRFVLAAFGARRMHSALEAARPDLVVSTYPAATSVLGTLRRRGKLHVPAYATVTDLAGVEFWAHRGVDLHLVMHAALIPVVEREAGAGSARAVAPLVAAPFHAAPNRCEARSALDLTQDDRVILVSGGGWGVGDLEGAATEAAALPRTTVICLTGRNALLRKELTSRFAQRPNVRVVGFADRMEVLLAAADALVHTTGGVTCLEAMTVGCPIIAFGPPAGHAPALAKAMSRLGIAAHARSRLELREALLAPRAATTASISTTAVQQLMSAKCRQPIAKPRRSRVGVAVALATAATAGFLTAGSRSAFAVIAYPFDLGPQSVLPTRAPEVGLVIQTSPRGVSRAVRLLAAHRVTASFAFAQLPSPTVRYALETYHDEVIAKLGGSGLDDWVRTTGSVANSAAGHFALAPAGGVSAGQYLLARLSGERLVASGSTLRRGAIVVCSGYSIGRVLERLAQRGLRAEAVGQLASRDVRGQSAAGRHVFSTSA